MDNAQHGRLRYADFSGNLAYGTMCLWLPFLTQNQLFDGRYVVFSACHFPSSDQSSLFPIAFSGGSPIHASSNFSLGIELTHQFCRPIVFQQIPIFMSTLSSPLNTIFDGFNTHTHLHTHVYLTKQATNSFFYNLFTYVVYYIQRIFNQNPKLKQ